MTGFEVDFLWYQIGSIGFLRSFFSTVCINLENGKRGSKYPYIMRELYQGELDFAKAPYALKELEEIKKGLAKLPPGKVIWNMDDLSERPSREINTRSNIKSLAEYYVNSDGDDFLTLLLHALQASEEIKEPVKIRTL